MNIQLPPRAIVEQANKVAQKLFEAWMALALDDKTVLHTLPDSFNEALFLASKALHQVQNWYDDLGHLAREAETKGSPTITLDEQTFKKLFHPDI